MIFINNFRIYWYKLLFLYNLHLSSQYNFTFNGKLIGMKLHWIAAMVIIILFMLSGCIDEGQKTTYDINILCPKKLYQKK